MDPEENDGDDDEPGPVPVGEDAFLNEEDEEEGEGEGEGEGKEDDEEPDAHATVRLCRLMSNTIFLGFESHVQDLTRARERRREALAFKSAVEEGTAAADESNAKQTQDVLDGLGVWMPGDHYQGDVNMRTLKKLLARVDARGFERCAVATTLASHCLLTELSARRRSAQQLEFHVAFMKAAARVIYKGSWETDRPMIMVSIFAADFFSRCAVNSQLTFAFFVCRINMDGSAATPRC